MLEGHTDRVDAVTVSPDGTRIVTASGDRTARVWDAKTGATRNVLRGHGLDVLAVAYAPEGTRIVTGSWDETARVWDATTGKALHTLNEGTRPQWWRWQSPPTAAVSPPPATTGRRGCGMQPRARRSLRCCTISQYGG